MTNNQIQYWKLQQDRSALAETQRHNLETEKLGVATLNETSRHNVAGEQHNVSVLSESNRHNLASEKLDIGKLAETNRHNLVEESLKDAANLINRFVASTNNSNKLTELYEQQRSNRSREAETERHNKALEALDQFEAIVEQNYKSAMIADRAKGRELEAQKIEDQWDQWYWDYQLNKTKYITELDKWQREKNIDNIQWGVGELVDLFKTILRGSRR